MKEKKENKELGIENGAKRRDLYTDWAYCLGKRSRTETERSKTKQFYKRIVGMTQFFQCDG